MPFAELRYFSQALAKHTSANLILPDPGLQGPYHVMFLLHGMSDDHTIWMRRTSIERYCDGLPLIVVMPDGARSLYADAIHGYPYEKALAVELPKIIGAYFPVHKQWSVTGLSMGGYGALRFALRFPELFVSANSHSGATNLGHSGTYKDQPMSDELTLVLGTNPEGSVNDLYALSANLEPAKRPKLRIDCGTEDFLIEHNREFHRHLDAIGYDHVYQEFPGAHEWGYWDLHVQDALAFHKKNLGF